MNDLEANNQDNHFTDYLYNWDSFDINLDESWAMHSWLDNLKAYMDDTVNTINKSVFDLLSGNIVNDEYSNYELYEEKKINISYTRK